MRFIRKFCRLYSVMKASRPQPGCVLPSFQSLTSAGPFGPHTSASPTGIIPSAELSRYSSLCHQGVVEKFMFILGVSFHHVEQSDNLCLGFSESQHLGHPSTVAR